MRKAAIIQEAGVVVEVEILIFCEQCVQLLHFLPEKSIISIMGRNGIFLFQKGKIVVWLPAMFSFFHNLNGGYIWTRRI